MGLFGGKKPPETPKTRRERVRQELSEPEAEAVIEEPQPHPAYLNAETEFRGIVLHGCETPGWIENKNTFPVLVVATLPLLNGTKIVGERRVVNFILKAGERSERQRVPRLAQYQIWSETGGFLGFVQASPNGR